MNVEVPVILNVNIVQTSSNKIFSFFILWAPCKFKFIIESTHFAANFVDLFFFAADRRQQKTKNGANAHY